MAAKEIEITGSSQVINVVLKKHLIKRKILAGITMVVDVEVNISIGNVKLNTFTIQSDFVLTADEFNALRKELNVSPSVAGGD
jgi:hypothetical protein